MIAVRVVPDTIQGYNVQELHKGWFGKRKWVTVTWAVTLTGAEQKAQMLREVQR